MKKTDCKLIATIPSMNNMEKVKRVFENPYISELRFNTGVQTATSIEETLEILKELSIQYQKKLWIDIKGRQLRVTKWADPLYSCVELNHKIQLLYPAQIHFRNGDRVNIKHVKEGNKIFVDPLPRQALGAGQSVNILAKGIEIDGYLTQQDKQYLIACEKKNMNHIMASFVECFEDLAQILQFLPKAQIVAKIESLEGMRFIQNYKLQGLMAARDDLYMQSGQSYEILKHLKTIISIDKEAICASKIFLSLEKRETIDLADFADLELMYQLGYRRFMLCDNICNYCLEEAMKGWEEFING